MLTWRRGLPDVPGYYWVRLTDQNPARYPIDPYIVEVREYGDGLAIGNSTLKGWRRMEAADWAGPIELPQEV